LKDGQILRFSNGLVFGCSVLPEKDNLNTWIVWYSDVHFILQ
jgi:hypothetical protein